MGPEEGWEREKVNLRTFVGKAKHDVDSSVFVPLTTALTLVSRSNPLFLFVFSSVCAVLLV